MVCPVFQISLTHRQLVEQFNLDPAKPQGHAEGKTKLRRVHVPTHRLHRSDCPQFVQHFLIAHVSCMQHQLDTRQQLPETRVEETMRI